MSAVSSNPANPLTPGQIAFRHAMAHLPAAVNIVTTRGEAGECGMTASAVCSVTDTPPTLLVCIHRSSSTHAVFQKNGRLCVNVLSAEQEELARHFAGMTKIPMEERFKWDIWENATPQSQPVLKDALASLSGRITELKDVGTHSVMFVELDEMRVKEDKDSLVYFKRLFHPVRHA